jgi:hypothetical protein
MVQERIFPTSDLSGRKEDMKSYGNAFENKIGSGPLS